MRAEQATLFGEELDAVARAPAGLRFEADFISAAEEEVLLARLRELPLEPFAFHGWTGKRETTSFGWRYDFSAARMHPAAPIPEFLQVLRDRAAAFAGVAAPQLEQALVIRYDIGAGIGWHRDRPVFDQVVGVSLLAPCVLRFRRRDGVRFRRYSLHAPPRSAYLLSGEIRHLWEHSISPMERLRYSITFRSRRPA